MMNYPRIFALFCKSTGTVEYSNAQYTAIKRFYDAIPDILKDNFEIVRYDASPLYTSK